jgi:beta-phosphoglucomutase-like phosphatase (HAD superfamily)
MRTTANGRQRRIRISLRLNPVVPRATDILVSCLVTGLFDTVVISGECGMRKPDEAIFLHTAKGLGLAPRQCVFIDDLEANVAAAAACGMTGVHHTEAAQTIAAVQDLLGIPAGPALATRCDNHPGGPAGPGLACQAWRIIRIPPARAGRRT